MLFAFAGGQGHLEPMLPLALALRRAGYDVAVAGDAAVVSQTRGFLDRFPYESALSSDTTTGNLLVPDLEHELEVIGRHFVGDLGRRHATWTGEVIQRWTPDLLVCDEVDFGALAAAERAGLPRVTVKVIASGALVRAELIAQPLAQLRAELDLPGDPDLRMLDGDLVVSPFAPSFRDPRFPLPPDAVSVRPIADLPAGRSEAARWFTADGIEPRIYFTLGTVFNSESGDLFTRVLHGLHHLHARVLVTVGRNIDPATLGTWPSNVRVERFVPQAEVLDTCDLVINHGGSGSVTAALAHGVPLVVLPMGADQELNAERIAALGLGTYLDAVTSTPAQISAAVASVQASATSKQAAEAIRREIQALPPAAAAVPRLEALVRAGQTGTHTAV